jgi:uncharacterized membrane protein
MAFLYTAQGFVHILNPAFFVRMIPPELPNPEWLNLIAGLAEIVLGVFVLEPRTRVFAAWGLIALLIAVFPVNVHAALAGSDLGPWVRLPFQAAFIVWAWWYTRPDEELEA